MYVFIKYDRFVCLMVTFLVIMSLVFTNSIDYMERRTPRSEVRR